MILRYFLRYDLCGCITVAGRIDRSVGTGFATGAVEIIGDVASIVIVGAAATGAGEESLDMVM